MNAVTKGLYTETPKEQYPLLTTRCMVSGNSKRWAEQGGFTVEAFSHVKRFGWINASCSFSRDRVKESKETQVVQCYIAYIWIVALSGHTSCTAASNTPSRFNQERNGKTS